MLIYDICWPKGIKSVEEALQGVSVNLLPWKTFKEGAPRGICGHVPLENFYKLHI